ncbi:LysR family transcriptional regulator [Clostridium sp. chh4-2]|uniref:LysR family transcriptional regulator n=1 Tax=Clostridium sp. chh4-2 TaxID=2067550 RepID=UPI000CCEAEF7|nr:LysR family transcriptional regulator [Clostridium sp. chh4-2]PNV61271.1 LysR family transcriptional regulator [Clostridium sp. chh4-2]
METRQIYTFIKVAQLQSFSKAAEELGYSQSAVTVQIKLLENELETRLFDRVGKKITLTHQGEQFYVYSNNILKEMFEAKKALRGQGPLSGVLRIGTIESLCFSKFPPILHYFYEHHPNVTVQILTGSPEELIDMMEHNKVDIIYLLDRPLYHTNWIKVLEKEDEVVFTASVQSPFAGKKGLELKDILQERFVLTEKDANYRKELDVLLASKGCQVTPFLEISNTEFIINLVKQNMGLSFLPHFTIKESVANHRLAILDVSDFHISMWRQIIYHRDKWVTREMTEFIRLAQLDFYQPDICESSE